VNHAEPLTSATGRPGYADVTRAVVRNQALWTAGYSLTTGGFLTYFGRELGASSFLIAVLLVTPETVGVLGLGSRWVIQRFQNRKRIWIVFSLAARLVSLGIPLLAFPQLRPPGIDPVWCLIGCLAISQVLGIVAYLAYLSWLSDLVDDDRWGRFFARRSISRLCVLLVVPVAGGYLRDFWRSLVSTNDMSEQVALLAYVATFTLGVVLMLSSMLPLLRLPNLPVQSETLVLPEWKLIADAFRNRSMRFLLIHNWWLAAANGMTQAAFFKYRYDVLHIPLGTYYVLAGVMSGTMILVSALAGRICDSSGNKAPLFWGALLASCAMPFWLLATAEKWWWLFAASVLWGSFAAVNIAGRNLALKLAPPSDNAAHLGLFRLVGGLLAGLSGLAGGLWLDHLLGSGLEITWAGYRIGGYQIVFLVSWMGRFTAPFWVLPIHEPPHRSDGNADQRQIASTDMPPIA
jgi:hypothetical protein